jgi:hypothetical protein
MGQPTRPTNDPAQRLSPEQLYLTEKERRIAQGKAVMSARPLSASILASARDELTRQTAKKTRNSGRKGTK